jgi:hypothetical protein
MRQGLLHEARSILDGSGATAGPTVLDCVNHPTYRVAGVMATGADASLSRPSHEGAVGRNLAWVLVLLGHVAAFPYYERLNNPNENVRVWTSKALAEHHQFAIDPVERVWGAVDDKVSARGHFYSAKAPGTSLVGAPVVLAHDALRRAFGRPPPSKRETTLVLRLFGVALPLGAFFWMFSRYIGRVARSSVARDLIVVGLGLGSVMYPYGVIFVGHALGAALAFVAFMLLAPPEPAAPASGRARFWAGMAAGAAVLFEYQLGVVALVLAGYAFWRYRAGVLLVLAGAAPAALFLAGYHTAIFGKPWALPWEHVTNPGFAAYHAHGFLGLTAPRPGAIAAMLFSSDLGLFIFSPFLLAGVAGAALAIVGRAGRHRHRAEAITVLAACAAALLFISSMTFWRGGWCAGPRYISVVAPFLAWGVAQLWASWPAAEGDHRPRPPAIVTAALAGTVVVSVFMSGISAIVYPHYPPQLDNPVFDLALPLLRAGFVPYSLGWALGLRGLASLAPLGAVLLLAISLGLGGDSQRLRAQIAHTAGAALVAVALLAGFARLGGPPNPTEVHAREVVQLIWEPRP